MRPRETPARALPDAEGSGDDFENGCLGRGIRHRIRAREPGPVRRGSDAEHAREVLAQHRRRPEAALVRDAVEAEIGLLEEALGVDDALPGEPGGRRRTEVGLEAAGERARRHVGLGGELVDGELETDVLEHPVGDGRERQALHLGEGLVDELGLTAVALRRNDHAPGDLVGELGAELLHTLSTHAPRAAARRTTSMTRRSTARQERRGIGVTTTRSASSANVRSCSTLIEKAMLARTAPGSGVTIRKSKFGIPSSDRSSPNASHARPNSKGANPSWTMTATVFMARSRTGRGDASARTKGGSFR